MDRNISLSAAGTTNVTESADVAKEAVADDLLVESDLSRELIESEVENHADGDPTIAKMETRVVLAKATQAEDGTILAAVNSSLLSEVENHADGDPTTAKMETNVVLAKATQAEDGTINAALNIVNSSLLSEVENRADGDPTIAKMKTNVVLAKATQAEDGTILAALEQDNVTSTNAVCIATELTHVEAPPPPHAEAPQPLLPLLTFPLNKVSSTHQRPLRTTHKRRLMDLTVNMTEFLGIDIPEGTLGLKSRHDIAANFEDRTTGVLHTIVISCFTDKAGRHRSEIPQKYWRDMMIKPYLFGPDVTLHLEILNVTTVGFHFISDGQVLQPVAQVQAPQQLQLEDAPVQATQEDAPEVQVEEVDGTREVQQNNDNEDAGIKSFRLFGKLIVARAPK